MRVGTRLARPAGLRLEPDSRAPPPPLRVQLPLRTHAQRARPQDFRPVAGREVRRDRGAAGPPVVSRGAVPPGIQIQADASTPAVRRVCRRVLSAQDGTPCAPQRHGIGRVGQGGRVGIIHLVTPLQLGDLSFGGGSPFVLIAGPCVIETEQQATDLAGRLCDIARRARVPLVFKASYDKANRTSGGSFRGPGLDEGLRILGAIQSRFSVPILTDIHEPSHARAAGDVADVLQIPAFLSRQTDLLVAAAKTGRIVNIKKGQFLAPDDMRHAVAKVVDAGNPRVIVTERGTSFGYHNLVVDMRAFPMMRAQGVPVVFDVTHSLQLPGDGDGVTAGLAEYIEPLASAGVAAGVDGVFLEVHEEPARAKSDAQNTLRLDRLEPLLQRLLAIDAIAKQAEAHQHG